MDGCLGREVIACVLCDMVGLNLIRTAGILDKKEYNIYQHSSYHNTYNYKTI